MHAGGRCDLRVVRWPPHNSRKRAHACRWEMRSPSCEVATSQLAKASTCMPTGDAISELRGGHLTTRESEHMHAGGRCDLRVVRWPPHNSRKRAHACVHRDNRAHRRFYQTGTFLREFSSDSPVLVHKFLCT